LGDQMAKYPRIILPDEYLQALILGKAKISDAVFQINEEGVILCDYCLEQFKNATSPKRFYAGGWLTDERCPIHKHYWLKLWFLL